ncbi:hypothetical protein DL93DRAFT_163538 [Clavulina sp. PMI_390]|nr:hypothetical protein DL93DRAFT_163538 [Clavulina sp. PMI_390]
MSSQSYVQGWYNERQQYKKVPTDYAERKEPRCRRRCIRQSSLPSSVHPTHQHQLRLSLSPSPPPPTHTHTAVPPWKTHLRRAGVVAAIMGMLLLILILIVTLIMLTEKLRAVAAMLKSLRCSAG